MSKSTGNMGNVAHLFKKPESVQPAEHSSAPFSGAAGTPHHEDVAPAAEKFSGYEAIGMDALVARLRQELRNIQARDDGLNSLNKLSAKIDVSRTYLAKFRDGGMVCMNIMNRIANAFQIRYLIENYEEIDQAPIK